MKQISLLITDIDQLIAINSKLLMGEALTPTDLQSLTSFLSNLPNVENLLTDNVALDLPLSILLWDTDKIDAILDQWEVLFKNIPSYNNSTLCIRTNNKEAVLLNLNTLIVTMFSPSLSYAMDLENIAINHGGFEVHLKDDGSAKFNLPTLQDAEAYPELYNFKGSWKEAYYLLIETLKKGWPMEEFPEELQQFLKK
ncbi:hypothetical protein J3L18_22355 [Mucilaginibacter gossypii]|uniref:hypothetical protein n=1 Tax=Mucilaginibacter gossypii TaxID=551996 RepID=UPI000DCE63BE|nr:MULTISPECIES: hypothetical protein [Mucilaginibacter]QTE35869.1 hypothetical protein J3L18_22355 [Mucilaginibacter gossypii]RAV54675.1 hypothetical protein DIU36_20040 [Mucilaginibacter rubeus]